MAKQSNSRHITRRTFGISSLCALLTSTAFSSHGLADYPGIAGKVPAPKKQYSPYLQDNYPDRVFFGDTHVHTSFSSDAGLLGNTLGPDEAYKFAKGEEVTASNGVRARLHRPLDFLVVADHAENLGLAPAIAESNADLLKTEFGRRIHALTKAGKTSEAFTLWSQGLGGGKDPLTGNNALTRSMWERLTTSAEEHNKPGKFTAFQGYEWTSGPGGSNLHRNIIFRDNKSKVDRIIPLSTYDTADPEKLWEWMARYEKNTGGRVLAIPHNGNLSNGLMFDAITLNSKKPLDRDYSKRRMRWEPLYEVTQMKGDGEAHPKLSLNDEFADFETWDKGDFGPQPKTPDMLPREYAREALKRGLAFEQKLGVNPFKFGMIGASDTHTALATTTEDNYFGKATMVEPTADPIRFNEKITGYAQKPGGPDVTIRHYKTSASGLAGVWAKENTRESIWDAMARKEVYATTGTRMKVRIFAGYDFKADDVHRPDFAKRGYETGVPMGGDLFKAPAGKSPALVIRALRDADGANLDRIQVIKGWLDKNGKLHEKIIDVAWSDPHTRKPGKNGKLPAVGNTVNVPDASYTNKIGAPMLFGYWQDPAFSPQERAFYYVRVLEIPTPRWTTHDAKKFKVKLPKGVPASIQERAYTSPIWYTPSS